MDVFAEIIFGRPAAQAADQVARPGRPMHVQKKFRSYPWGTGSGPLDPPFPLGGRGLGPWIHPALGGRGLGPGSTLSLGTGSGPLDPPHPWGMGSGPWVHPIPGGTGSGPLDPPLSLGGKGSGPLDPPFPWGMGSGPLNPPLPLGDGVWAPGSTPGATPAQQTYLHRPSAWQPEI